MDYSGRDRMVGRTESSELRCARHMFLVMRGHYELDQDEYTVDDIAIRYGVRADTVYRAVRAGDPLYPAAHRKGQGLKAWLYFSRATVAQCDQDRLAFYKTTPSWKRLHGEEAGSASPRRAAHVVIAESKAGRKT